MNLLREVIAWHVSICLSGGCRLSDVDVEVDCVSMLLLFLHVYGDQRLVAFLMMSSQLVGCGDGLVYGIQEVFDEFELRVR